MRWHPVREREREREPSHNTNTPSQRTKTPCAQASARTRATTREHLGFRVSGLRFRVWGQHLGFRVSGLGFRVWGQGHKRKRGPGKMHAHESREAHTCDIRCRDRGRGLEWARLCVYLESRVRGTSNLSRPRRGTDRDRDRRTTRLYLNPNP
jgi:hypothetical protein